jgi:hypothetical protein
MKKLAIGAILIMVVVIAMEAFTTTETKKAGGEWKNLKILPQDISKEDLHNIMNGYTLALGVRCGFCHARKADTTQRGLDFASDAKEEKGTAREMMKMVHMLNTGTTFNYMNSTKPDTIHTIICYTCHRGVKQPTSASLMPEINKIEEDQEKQWKEQHPGGK